MDLTTQTRETYAQMWDVPAYAAHSPGVMLLPIFLDMTRTTMRGSVLDAGCGSGQGALALQAAGFPVTCCDITDAGLTQEARALPFHEVCLWGNLKRSVGFHEWVYCTDVLEHVPPQFTMLAVSRLLEVARRGVFLSVCLQADNLGVWIGESLHLTVESFTWWRDALRELGTVVEARDLLHSGVFLVEPVRAQ